ncbi:MAG: carboxypeptidase regulatory-like domain-containing protein, partial [Armatimonadota bacterium]
DFYLDVIVRDNAGNEFIYDNISGFTTKRFVGANKILLVSDYAAGQMFVQNRIDFIGSPDSAGGRPTWLPVESYWTDNPTGKPPYDIAINPAGVPIIGDGAIPSPTVFLATIRSDTLGGNTTYGNLYDIWRVQCRNPIPPQVLAGYLPRYEQEPTDLRGGSRTKLHAERIVVWASPYTGDLWAGPGHLLDPEVQATLRNFLAAAGRLVVSGQDVAWALSLAGGLSNQFLQQILQAQYDFDTAQDVFLPQPYIRLRHQLDADELEFNPDRPGALDPTTFDPNPIAFNPGGIPIWFIVDGGVKTTPDELQIADPATLLPDGTILRITPPGQPGINSDGAWNQIWLDTVFTTPDNRAPYKYTNPGISNDPDRQRAGTYYENPTNRSKIAFFAFGLEGVDSGYEQIGNVIWCSSFRNKVLHNAYAWMTHSILRGRVLEYDPETRTFRPLPRAFVRVTGLQPPSLLGVEAGYAITDSAGEYTIFGLEPGIYLIDAVRPGYRVQHPETVVLVAEDTAVNLVMLKIPPGQISGRVIDINNQPVRYAVVQATSVEDPQLSVTTLSDLDGTFLIPRVPVGNWNVTVVSVVFGGYTLPPVRPQPNGVFRNVQVQGGQTTALPEDFVLEPLPGTIRGRVTRADNGQPIQGARVVAVANNVERGFALTDANGNYSFQVPGGEYQVTATAPGFAPSTQTVNVPREGEIEVNFQLAKLPPGRVTGRIVRKFGGAPEPGVTVEILFAGTVVYTATTDANGNYTIDTVEPGDYEVRPRKTGFTFEPPTRTITVNPNQTTTVPEFKSQPLRTFFRGRYLVSAPFDYTQDVADLLDVPPDKRQYPNFRFFTWDTATNRYIFYPDAPANRFVLGRGYFIETTTDLPLAIEGTPADETRNFEIRLRKGWNLIGTPFRFDIDWEQTQVIDPDTNAPISNATAVGKQIIANALWGYAFGNYNVTRRMRIWEGYWVYAYRDTTLIIPPSARARSATSRSITSPIPSGWTLTLQVQSGELSDQAYIGVSRSASPGYDVEHDLLKPPPVGRDYVYISIPRLNWGAQSGFYGVDVQASTRSASWEFTVETTQPGREITLRWPNIHQLPRSVNPVLIDLQTGARRYLRTTGAYTFRSPQGGVSRFRIEMASSAGLLRITNVQVTGGRGNQRTIAFTLTGEASVEVKVLAGGKIVRQLMHSAGRSAGVQQVSWDGRDQQGIALPPGAYTVEIQAVSEDGQVARAATTVILTR